MFQFPEALTTTSKPFVTIRWNLFYETLNILTSRIEFGVTLLIMIVGQDVI
jgi:hypothetical protein